MFFFSDSVFLQVTCYKLNVCEAKRLIVQATRPGERWTAPLQMACLKITPRDKSNTLTCSQSTYFSKGHSNGTINHVIRPEIVGKSEFLFVLGFFLMIRSS